MVFYADVYFLINFTVDTLALYFAVSVSKIKSSVKRIILLAAVGALLALLSVLYFGGLFGEMILACIYFPIVGVFISGNLTLYRRVKVTALFAIFEFLTGGVVSFGYEFLDRHFYWQEDFSSPEAPDRRLLLLAVMILLSMGVFKLLVLFFSHSVTERHVNLSLSLLGKDVSTEAFVDTGNLLRDTNGKSVILIKRELAKKLHREFPLSDTELTELAPELVSRISLIPVKGVGARGILVALRIDSIKIISDDGKERGEISAVVAADKEGGTYDGFSALMPAAALDDIK